MQLSQMSRQQKVNLWVIGNWPALVQLGKAPVGLLLKLGAHQQQAFKDLMAAGFTPGEEEVQAAVANYEAQSERFR